MAVSFAGHARGNAFFFG